MWMVLSSPTQALAPSNTGFSPAISSMNSLGMSTATLQERNSLKRKCTETLDGVVAAETVNKIETRKRDRVRLQVQLEGTKSDLLYKRSLYEDSLKQMDLKLKQVDESQRRIDETVVEEEVVFTSEELATVWGHAIPKPSEENIEATAMWIVFQSMKENERVIAIQSSQGRSDSWRRQRTGSSCGAGSMDASSVDVSRVEGSVDVSRVEATNATDGDAVSCEQW